MILRTPPGDYEGILGKGEIAIFRSMERSEVMLGACYAEQHTGKLVPNSKSIKAR